MFRGAGGECMLRSVVCILYTYTAGLYYFIVHLITILLNTYVGMAKGNVCNSSYETDTKCDNIVVNVSIDMHCAARCCSYIAFNSATF